MATDRGSRPEGLAAASGVISSPELTVGTSHVGNVFSLLLLPYGFLSFSGRIMTICLYLCFEAVRWLLASWGFYREPPRYARWDKATHCKGASPWQHHSSLLHGPQPWALGLAMELSCPAVTTVDPCCWTALRGNATEAAPTTCCWADLGGNSGQRFEVTKNLEGIAVEVYDCTHESKYTALQPDRH